MRHHRVSGPTLPGMPASGSNDAAADDLDEVVRRLHPRLVRLAHIVTGSVAIAEEIVQDTYIEIHLRETSIQNIDAYLHRAVLNRCRSHLRRRRLEERHATGHQPIPLGEPTLDETWAAVLRLPIRQRSVIALRYYEDLTEVDVARILGCRVGTVKSAHHRALRALREELS